MEIFHHLDEVPTSWQRAAVTVGNFDGAHLGHQAIFTRLCERARELDARAIAITFDPHPVAFFRGVTASEWMINAPSQRAAAIAASGLDALVVLPFDRTLAAMSPEGFARQVLVDGVRAVDVLVGYDFRFGKGRAGTIEDLIRIGAQLGFAADVVEAVERDGAPISSSRVRAAIREGDVALAAALMGRPHALEGVVVHGAARGRGLGFPTANLEPAAQLSPPTGVYITRLREDSTGATHPAITNVGTRPTFEGDGAPVVIETFLLDPALPVDLDLYDTPVTLSFLERVRDEQRFDTPAALIAQVQQDIARARRFHGLTDEA